MGVNESIADYGWPYRMALGGAWAGGLLGCYIVPRIAQDSLTVPTMLWLSLLLAVPALFAVLEGRSRTEWPSLGRLLA